METRTETNEQIMRMGVAFSCLYCCGGLHFFGQGFHIKTVYYHRRLISDYSWGSRNSSSCSSTAAASAAAAAAAAAEAAAAAATAVAAAALFSQPASQPAS
jgi:hypothetical protein